MAVNIFLWLQREVKTFRGNKMYMIGINLNLINISLYGLN